MQVPIFDEAILRLRRGLIHLAMFSDSMRSKVTIDPARKEVFSLSTIGEVDIR